MTEKNSVELTLTKLRQEPMTEKEWQELKSSIRMQEITPTWIQGRKDEPFTDLNMIDSVSVLLCGIKNTLSLLTDNLSDNDLREQSAVTAMLEGQIEDCSNFLHNWYEQKK